MSKAMGRRVAALALAAALTAPAAPARAATNDSCHDPERIVYCACVLVVRLLSPVIPPETWNCPGD